jgi:hypothetical protein
MPFKNSKQQAACYALKSKGKNGSWDCKKWSKETNQKSLPKTAKKTKNGR